MKDEVYNNNSYKIEKIINEIKIKENKEFINYLCYIMNEKKIGIIEYLYKELGKNYLIFKLEQTLNIQNLGGQDKGISIYDNKNINKNINKNVRGKKTTGGIFFSLLKKDEEAKAIIKKASKLDAQFSKERKKMYKSFEKLSFNDIPK